MIIINLKGGLGNQMFQYALGRHLSLRNNATLKLETEGLARANAVGDIYRPFSLEKFNIVKDVATPEEVRTLKYPYGIVSKGLRFFKLRVLGQSNTVFNPAALTYTGDIFLDGYWQSPLYFDAIRETLLKELVLTAGFSATGQEYAKHMQTSDSVSLHVRRGDYVKSPTVQKEFGICTKEYYRAAIEAVSKRTINPTYFVFSDDIAWVKEHLPIGDNVVFVSGTELTDAEELALMSQCKHNIIANSTFSWWGAWLNQNPDKLVVAPTPWFDNNPYDASLIPDTWTQLPKT